MAHKTFISYKYSEARELRDRIISKLGDDSTYYKGETSESPNYSDMKTEYIKEKLKDMIYDTSVTVVILSPNVKLSKWIEWEIEYSLRNQSRYGRYSHPNGIIAVVQKQKYSYDGYSWMKDWYGNWNDSYLFDIIKENRNNKKAYASYNLSTNYIDIVTEEEFLHNPQKYIEQAYEKSQNFDSYR